MKLTKEEILADKAKAIADKMEAIKEADTIICAVHIPSVTAKEDPDHNKNSVTVKVVANSTNVLDSHMDVHIPGNYDQSISSKEGWKHLKDHERKSDSDVGIVQSVEKLAVKFSDLGIEKDGTSECLVYESEVLADLNKGIFYRYKAGLINQHSIGMRYRELELAINDKESPKEKAHWDQYISQIANPEKAHEAGYFWIVKNIELIECSAVMKGSNTATPTLQIKGSDLLAALKADSKPQKMDQIQHALKVQATITIAKANRNKRKRI